MSPENRETKKFKTPSGDEIEIYTYLTGREQRNIDYIMIKGIIPNSDENKLTGEIRVDIAKEQEDKILEILIVSINQKKDKLLDMVLDMKAIDYTFIINEINKQTTELKKK